MIKPLYDWTMSKINNPAGERWLGILSFAESSFFPIPPDVMLIPMVLADRAKAWRLATITTIASVLGAVLGYLIGMFLFDSVAQPLLDLYGYGEKYQAFADYYDEYGILIVLVAGLTPIPFKVITIASGVAGLNPFVFILSAIPARGLRFYLVAGLLWKFGEPIRTFIEKRLTLLFILGTVLLIGGFVALKFLIPAS
ncbi:YqaA family protein [Kordiimonas sediminis]|nr:YqaA family protein [Kordiimonas sediminis]